MNFLQFQWCNQFWMYPIAANADTICWVYLIYFLLKFEDINFYFDINIFIFILKKKPPCFWIGRLMYWFPCVLSKDASIFHLYVLSERKLRVLFYERIKYNFNWIKNRKLPVLNKINKKHWETEYFLNIVFWKNHNFFLLK